MIRYFVGIMGGAMYVNVFYLAVQDKRVPDRDRTLGVNLIALWITAGIISASMTTLALDKNNIIL